MIVALAKAGSGKFREELTLGSYRMASDVPLERGGDGSAPTPHELLAAALAACTAMTVRMYAARKGWPLEDAEVAVTMEGEGKGERIRTRLSLRGELDATQRARLLDIANRCPVHQTLAATLPIDTELG